MKKILFVDDDNTRVAEFRKRNPGHDIVHAPNSLAAFNLLPSTRFDMIFLDHDLGFDQKNGVDDTTIPIVKHIAANENEFLDCTIVIHSANSIGVANMMSHLKYFNGSVNKIHWAWTIEGLVDSLNPDFSSPPEIDHSQSPNPYKAPE